MRSFLILLSIVVLSAFAGGQTYSPRPDETVIKIIIEGRGNIFIKLHTKEAPKTTSHILDLVSEKFYDGQKVFRAEKTPRPYAIQLGDPITKTKDVNDEAVGKGGSGKSVPYEDSGFPNEEGAVGLAAIQGDKNSGDSQFYILMSPARFLDGGYTVFGKVVAGMDVVKRVERGDKVVSITVVH